MLNILAQCVSERQYYYIVSYIISQSFLIMFKIIYYLVNYLKVVSIFSAFSNAIICKCFTVLQVTLHLRQIALSVFKSCESSNGKSDGTDILQPRQSSMYRRYKEKPIFFLGNVKKFCICEKRLLKVDNVYFNY